METVHQVKGRPLREGVGRNRRLVDLVKVFRVALYARAWVEIVKDKLRGKCGGSRPLREGVGRNQRLPVIIHKSVVALYARAWVEIL